MKSNCILSLYGLLMLILCLGQTALVLALIIDEDKVLGINVDNANVDEAKAWVKAHIKIFIIVEAALAGVEFFLVVTACCYKSRIRRKPSKFGESMNEPLVEEERGEWWNTKPEEKSAKQQRRDEMRAKYGLD